ncbi:hypothetical protein [Streptococcus oricebi]|uniref:hypothetical protein n=1 Tax=Streptococcus oricebi TaxID=1547447 RepID=UPI001AEAEF20|nr:hypothetical protein [Streptococcus oricebi]
MKHDVKAISGLIWGLTTVTYLILGFFFNLWHPAWILFVLAGVIIRYLEFRSKHA